MTRSPSRIFLLAVVAAVLLQACPTKEKAQPKEEVRDVRTAMPCRPSTTPPDPNNPQIDCVAPPSTWNVSTYFAANAPKATMQQAGMAFDSWAWASFAAFNWPAKADANQPTGYVRGIPDTGASFAAATGTEVVVWETFKEKREVFNNNVQLAQWQELTYPPEQTVGGTVGVPACSPTEQQELDALAKRPGRAHRRLLQASKLAPALGTGPHELDETAEVSSPAQEPQNVLCAGYTGAALVTCQNAFPNPGTDPSVGFTPTMTNPRGGVGPRVRDLNKNLIYYEVRVNYDYFKYALMNGLNFVNPPPPPPPGGTPSIRAPYSLPWRTSAQAPPVDEPGPPIVPAKLRNSTVQYEAATTAGLYGSAPTTPPPIGSVQVKSAWKMLTPKDVVSQYHTTEAVYFRTVGGTPCYAVDRFGLIALHIIQRVHMGDSSAGNADPVGGTFVFATWEHNTIANGQGYTYVNFLANAGEDQVNPTPYPTWDNAIPVTRLQPYPLQSTTNVTQAVYKQLGPGSVWSNYRLIGTQFYPNVTAETSGNYNQPYYLANLVVETNTGLQNFQGLPPGVTPVLQGFQPKATTYNPLANNLQLNGNQYDMGGCMGCHGVAQVAGSNFSFVLLDGQRGAGIDTDIDVSIPPDLPPPTTTTQ